MAPDDLFTREEALGGLPARRAATLLFLIESRAAHLADQSRRTADFLVPESAARERDLAFLEAFSVGRAPPVRPTIQDLERHAPAWAPLVPANASVRAAVAHLLGRKYRFTRRAVPRIRAALGLDDETVARAYRRQHRAELDTIFVAQVRPRDWLPWAWARLSARIDALSPFWLTFALTIAFSLSQALLALPTGIARMGTIPGIVLVVAIGLVNVLTMACMAEACARSGDFRYGRAFVGRLVTDFLGSEASLLFSATTAVRTFLVLLAGALGLGLTLTAFTGIRADVWMVILLGVVLFYLSRKSTTVTIATMLCLIGLNILCVLAIMLLAVPRVHSANLFQMRVPVLTEGPAEAGVLGLAVGVVVMLYIGHVYVIQCAKIVLPRDPSARSMINGSMAGTAALTAIFTVWVLAVNGVVDAETLAGEVGTVLAPLAAEIGPAVHVLGSFLVVLLLGMSCLRTATVLFNLAQERIPTRLRATVTLPRRRGSLLLQPRSGSRHGPHIGITYLGLTEGHAHLRIEAAADGIVERVEPVVPGTWDAASLLGRFPKNATPGTSLVLGVFDARPETVSVRVSTTLSAELSGVWGTGGVTPSDIAAFDETQRALVNWMTRRGAVSVEEVAAFCGAGMTESRATLDELVGRGVVQPADGVAGRYRVQFGHRRPGRLPADIWEKLDVPSALASAGSRTARGRMALAARRLLSSDGGRFLAAASPVLLAFVFAEWLVLARAASFAGVLGFSGVIVNSLTAAVFPALLLVASRRKGDYVPAVIYRLLGHPAFTIGVCLLAIANLFLHGLVLYSNPWSRAAALLFGVIVIALAAVLVRRQVFGRRTVVELREDTRAGATSALTITSAGRPLTATVRLGDAAGESSVDAALVSVDAVSTLRSIALRLAPGAARELKVWTHRVTADGGSEPLSALAEIACGGLTRRFDLKLTRGQAIVPVSGDDCSIQLTFPDTEAGDAPPPPAAVEGAVRYNARPEAGGRST